MVGVTGTAWIQDLNKQELIEVCKLNNLVVTKTDTVDDLRRILRTHVKESLEEGAGDQVYTYEDLKISDTVKFAENQIIQEKLKTEESNQVRSPVFTLSALEETVEAMASDSSFVYDFKKDNWDDYTDRFECYLECMNITDDKRKVSSLLAKVGSEMFKYIKNVCTPTKPKDMTYAALIKKVSEQIDPKPNECMERYKYKEAKQGAKESVVEYVNRLKVLSKHCNFTDLDTELRDQMIGGIRDNETRTVLFSTKNLTFTTALELATTRESAVKNAACTGQQSSSASADGAVHHIGASRGGNGIGRKHAYSGNRSAGGRFSSNQGNVRDSNNKGVSYHNYSKFADRKAKRDIVCYCCGRINDHVSNVCKHRDKICNFCKGRGHFEIVCFKKSNKDAVLKNIFDNYRANKPQEREVKNIVENEDSDDNQILGYAHDSDFFKINVDIATQAIKFNKIEADPLFVDIIIEDRIVRMEVDTGAYITAISEFDKNEIFPDLNIEKSDLKLNSYGEIKLELLGVLKNLNVKFSNLNKKVDCYVMKGKGPRLIGRQWLKIFGKWPMNLISDNVNIHCLENDVKTQMIEKYPSVFSEGQGCYTGRKVHLTFRDDVKPVQLKPYHAPFALAPKIEAELDRLIKAGNLEPIAVSKWATPVLPVYKKDKDQVRLCGNFKLTVNPQLIIKRHPIPIKEKIFKTLQVGKEWSQLDLSHAFMQFRVDDESKEALTIITHKGLFCYTKLPEGIASSPDECQDILEEILRGIPNTEVYIDNIFCTGRTREEHLHILNQIFERLEKAGLKVNPDKCEFFKSQIEVLGFLIDQSGLKPTLSKVKAVHEAPIPRNQADLKAFLGLVNYYENFLPDRAEHARILYDMSNAKVFEWTSECDKAYTWMKNQITSDRVLALFDENEDLILACDASQYGLSAVLSHRFKDGTERPIAFASKIIPKSELHRAILDKEAGAIIFGFKKFYQYVWGKEIILRTDHEPLKFIFGKDKNLSVMIQNRLQRWAYFLSRFRYEIEVVKSKSNGNCDALSRLPINDKLQVFEREFDVINFIQTDCQTLDCKLVAKESSRDKTLFKITNFIVKGWPENAKNLNDIESNFFKKRCELSIENNCVLWGHRVVIPESLKAAMLNELHASHLGMVKMKQLARSYFWWPNLNRDIEEITSKCKNCLGARSEAPAVKFTPWQWPSKPWTRVHADFCGPFHGRMFLLMVDAHSKWPEAIDMGSNTRADKVVSVMRKIFCRFGLPEHMVVDNGPQLKSDEFRDFLKRNRIKCSFSPPYYPATNGAAENFVRTFKDKVDKIVADGKSLEYAVNLFLFDYRSTEHLTTGRSPSSLMYNREIRTRFDLLRSQVVSNVEKKQFDQVVHKRSNRERKFSEGERVYVKDYRTGAKGNCEAKIVRRLSPVTYEVGIVNGKAMKKHCNQLIKTKLSVSEKNVVKRSDKASVGLENVNLDSRKEPRRSERIKSRVVRN